ncbi:hypothetical protein NC651_034242 [Populus alba x Populus x berolinensis]|nr:hypothetical protein NC651_034242 [Populus alba x Populus x berolinensis]
MRRNPMAGSASITSHTMDDDLHMKLLYLENKEPKPVFHHNSASLLIGFYKIQLKDNQERAKREKTETLRAPISQPW